MRQQDDRPVLGRDVYIAPTAYVGGNVTIGDEVTIMHQVVIRGDIAPIRIGNGGNVQDGAVLHTAHNRALSIGQRVSIAHGAVVHCSCIGDETLIGTRAVLLDGCRIGSRCIVAAGTLLPPEFVVPDGVVVMGFPGRVIREVDDKDLETIEHVASSYQTLGRKHAAGSFPNIACSAPNCPP